MILNKVCDQPDEREFTEVTGQTENLEKILPKYSKYYSDVRQNGENISG
jgi:hypothetical protein